MNTMDQSTMNTMLGMLGAYMGVIVVFAIVMIVANWRIFTKAGEAGWKCIIPFYNDFIAFKLFWQTKFFWVGIACGVVSAVLSGIGGTMDPHSAVASVFVVICAVLGIVGAVLGIIKLHKMSVCFGHGIGFTLGLIFLNPIFLLILAFGSSEYQGNKVAE